MVGGVHEGPRGHKKGSRKMSNEVRACTKARKRNLENKPNKTCLRCGQSQKADQFQSKIEPDMCLGCRTYVCKHKYLDKPANKEKQKLYVKLRLTPNLKERYKTDFFYRLRILIGHAKERCSKKGLSFDLDKDWAKSKLPVCEQTGIPFFLDTSSKKRHAFTPSLDRVDPTGGYTKDNVKLVCLSYNLGKNEFSEEDFIKLCTAVANAQNKQQTFIDGGGI